jgi:F-type H+-transporting ATPase subunit b
LKERTKLMPQFDPSTFSSQIIWLVISFAGLYWALTRLTLPRIAEVLEARQSKIDDDLDRAVELEQQAKDALATYEAAVEAAKAEAQSVVRQGVEEMAAVAQKRHGEMAEKLAAQVSAAEARIAEAKETALANIRQVASEAARAATLRVIGVEIDQDQADAAVAVAAAARGGQG